ncbi:MAG: hypothetical protein PVJ57_07610 [Phycisphaerae bacterium]
MLRRFGILVFGVALAVAAAGQGAAPPLAQQQAAVRDRMQKLENRLLVLSRLLAETQPDKADRLRAALEKGGERQVRRRLERVEQLLREGSLSEAEQEQETLLRDLQEMLDALTDSGSDLDRRRAERERLEAFRQRIDEMRQDQLDELYRTQAAREEGEAASRVRLSEIERRQRGLERRATDLAEEMKKQREGAAQTPGERQIGTARQHMQDAADRLAEGTPAEAEVQQQAALEQLQRAQEELDDALRQVRREELEETLSALESRFKSMLAREREVRAGTGGLHEKGAANWNRTDRLRLAALAQTQAAVTEDGAGIVRILVAEGTTVILPDLAEHLVDDMKTATARLEGADTSPATQALVDGIISALEEIIGAIEVRRDQETEAAQQPGRSTGGGGGSRPLLSPSAELKLLRSAQLRINWRTTELAGTPESAERTAALEQLAARQRQIAEMSRRMGGQP